MPSQNGMMVLLGAAVGLLAASTSLGCVGGVCEEFPRLCGDGLGGGGAGGDGGATTSTSNGGNGQGGNGGEGGGLPVDCDPLALAAGTAIPATCGIFVDTASSAAGESGTQAAPYKSLGAALGAAAADQRIYVCTSPLDEAALIEADTRLYGGLDCATWATGSAAARTAWTAPANEIPLAVRGASVSATVAGFAITARDAAGFDVASRQGRSSIAAWVEQASVHLERVELLAGQGAPGADGLPQAKVATPGAADGTAGGAGCLGNAGTFGATPGEQTCGTVVVDGGLGGNGTSAANGGNGSDGEPLGTMGKGGKGETASMPIACANGAEGATGGSGTPGFGASESSFGTLSAMTYVGPAGSTGLAAGVPGQGGGGGGGANLCTTGMQGAGPSGGGGGAGGCGGNPGNGGGGGGGSLGLASVNATISLVNSTIAASDGGSGGTGDAGQEGMDGGSGGNPGAPAGACSGGPGGKGGRGGAGGGGRGGPSVAIAFVGTAPVEVGGVVLGIASTASAGGLGGNGGPGNLGGTGANGLLELRQQWP